MAHIVIGCGAMAFGPDTLKYRSLGGSETAALMLGKSLAERGHKVIMFCNMPEQDHPDFAPPGKKADDGVIYVPIQSFGEYTSMTEHDLLIAVRDPNLCASNAQAAKKVLWMHDIATVRGMKRAFEEMSFLIDEVWTVSEWHRQQVAKVTGYSLDHIVALRNGIVPVETPAVMRSSKQLVYAARPERGLDNLIKPGGIMEHLPEYTLKVAMYSHFPEHMRDFYATVFKRMEELPNVDYIGEQTQQQLRTIISESAGYIYPTQFEETSCILARECIERETPFFTTRVGALEETLGNCGIFFEDWLNEMRLPEPELIIPEKGSPEWCKLFADFVREELTASRCWVESSVANMKNRTDLYWDGVAELVEANMQPKPVKPFSHLYSLMQDSDIVTALAWLRDYVARGGDETLLPGLRDELEFYRPILEGDLQEFYEDEVYRAKSDTPNSELVFKLDYDKSLRWRMIREEIAALPSGSRVVEYGCGPGHVLAPLARDFPHIQFVGYDLSASAIAVLNEGVKEHNFTNLLGAVVSPIDDPKCDIFHDAFDAAICTEMLEHVPRPWDYLEFVERLVKPGGRVILTTPQGNWETISHRKPGAWAVREHIWHIDRQMLLDMTGEKPNSNWRNLVISNDAWGRIVGHIFYAYDADHKAPNEIDPLEKAKRHRPRQSVAAAIIAYNNEDTIVRMLNSLAEQVQFVQIALGPCTDRTRELTEDWFSKHPHIRYNIIDVPKIEAYKFGFDEARNASVEGLYERFDWVLWIDTDEYLSGDIRWYLKHNQLDGYLIAQHHFSVQPRGKPPEIDRPARLMRSTSDFKAKGHIHEHFEIDEGGPGRCYMLPNVDIGHPGYVNEEVRRDRFARNYPFLEWDHKEQDTNPRKLHHFLWFRDIIHRMRFTPEKARELAEEAVEYYNSHREEMALFGPGLHQSMRYLSEAYEILGRGIPLKVTIQLDDRGTELVGKFESYKQIEASIAQILKPEFEERLSRYY